MQMVPDVIENYHYDLIWIMEFSEIELHVYFTLYTLSPTAVRTQYNGIANVLSPSYPIRLQKSGSGFNASILIRDASSIDNVILRLAALMNKFFPYYALFKVLAVVEQLAPVKSYLVSVPLAKSRYIAPPCPEAVQTVQLVNVVLLIPIIDKHTLELASFIIYAYIAPPTFVVTQRQVNTV
ncbi:MAG: hypothetical protein EZS28_017882 [Streblomastix strix]|uniref:Uncharacterized protein n=1 Tax=Streblomastix strix TaxID=222440 RepID=A0A5J4VV71_9EUKA|nr:MAG: hypothetical protein EZS28_017882 [Streblomastix strix]